MIGGDLSEKKGREKYFDFKTCPWWKKVKKNETEICQENSASKAKMASKLIGIVALHSPSKSVCHREDENATEWFQNWKGRGCGAVGRGGVSEASGTWFESNRHRINLRLRGQKRSW